MNLQKCLLYNNVAFPLKDFPEFVFPKSADKCLFIRDKNLCVPVMEKIENMRIIFGKISNIVTANSGISYTVSESEFGSLPGSTYKWTGGVLAPNGKIYGIPYNSTTVLEIDPVNKTTSEFGTHSGPAYKWIGGVLAPNGKIYGIPYYGITILEIDPVNKTSTEFGSFPGSTYKWSGGVLAPNGKIYGIPCNSTTVLEIDPVNKTTSEFGSLSEWGKWRGGVLAPNGKIYGIPYDFSSILEISFDWTGQPFTTDICISNYLNKI